MLVLQGDRAGGVCTHSGERAEKQQSVEEELLEPH